jgi:hypothetical protein
MRMKAALELRMAGRTYQEIADAIGYKTPQGAIMAVKAMLDRTLKPPAEQWRALTVERLTKVLQVYWPSMLQGNHDATHEVLEAITDLRQVLGIDAPVKGLGTTINLDNRKVEIIVQSEQGKELTARILEGMPTLEEGKA